MIKLILLLHSFEAHAASAVHMAVFGINTDYQLYMHMYEIYFKILKSLIKVNNSKWRHNSFNDMCHVAETSAKLSKLTS